MNRTGQSRLGLWIACTLPALWFAGCGDEYHATEAGPGSGGSDVEPDVGGAPGAGATARATGGRASSTAAGASSQAGASNGGVGAGPTGTGGADAQGGAENGGVPAAGAGGTAVVVTGGAPVGTGGQAPVTGGTTSSGGTGCGTTPSTFSEELTFTTTTTPLQLLSDNLTSAALKFASSVGSPTSNPSLCSNNCAALVATFPATTSAGNMNARAVQFFTPNQNLVGTAITVSLAVDNPAGVPVQLKLFAGADPSNSYAWGNTTTVTAPAFSNAFSAASGFKDITVNVIDKAPFCASATYYLAVWLDVAGTIPTAGTVTLYMKKLTVKAAGSGAGGAGGAGGTGGGTAGNSNTVGNAGTAGKLISNGNAGTAGKSTTSGVGAAGATSTSGGAAGTTTAVASAGAAGVAGSAN